MPGEDLGEEIDAPLLKGFWKDGVVGVGEGPVDYLERALPLR